MAHFAKVENGIVSHVIVAEPEFFDDFVDTSPGEWIQTSYNTRGGIHWDPETGEPSADQTKALRYNYAGVGHTYDAEADAFYGPKPFPSWVLNTNNYQWEAPIPAVPPEDNPGAIMIWDEDAYQADNTTGWVVQVNE